MSKELEPIRPVEAKEMYLRERGTDASDATIEAHDYRLGHFIRWCEVEEIENLNDLSGRALHQYKLWRQDDGDLNQVSVKTQMDTLRVFIRFCESIDAVETDLHTSILSPTLSDGENQRDVMLDPEEAEALLDYLGRFQYASRAHTLMALLWHTGIRTGAAHALDVEDYDPEEQRLKVRHRSGTPLKNKEEGERLVALSDEVCRILDDWLSHERPDVVDEYGRQPLLSTSHGRAHKTTVRETVYRWTRPCQYVSECPHGRQQDSCEAVKGNRKTASKCPSSVSPHAIRRGSITHHLSEDVPEKVVSDRMNVGQEVLDMHYDQRSEEVKVEQRRDYLEGV
ncbi:integrase family protein [Halorhabdus utahensis DSM 12940]|uniref:Integrase family protein n=1 Tax=Halorhabdus utahensis (strain DSM 12940 / JCM 11049 / AX-2) TaxID=519442 RepID=C7NP08_HALUD|nr:site-specific integrase [Halorhabdus utahensis]ACV10299.1 integrase family protein [Halorhabdus utahensis DSM 12940]